MVKSKSLRGSSVGAGIGAFLLVATMCSLGAAGAASTTPTTASSNSAAAVAAPTPAPSSASAAVPHPIDLPTGPQASAAACPNPPQLSSPLPSGDSISAPSLVPPNTGMVVANGVVHDMAGTCEYTITYPSPSTSSNPTTQVTPDSFTWVDSNNDYATCDVGVLCQIYFDYQGQYCYTSAELLNSGGDAYAQQELDSGYCNTYGINLGYCQAYNTSEQGALATSEDTFHFLFSSVEGGSIFFGQFAEVQEYPEGQTQTFVGTWNNYSPLF